MIKRQEKTSLRKPPNDLRLKGLARSWLRMRKRNTAPRRGSNAARGAEEQSMRGL